MANGLNDRQKAFVGFYLGEARFNATKAARLAGYAEKSASVEGVRLLANANVAARVQEELKAKAMPAEAVLAELTDVASAEWHEFVEIQWGDDGKPLKVKMDLSNKVKSLEILAKAHGLLTDRIDLTGNMTSTVELVGVAAEDV